ncbi:hypothetical protein BIY21_14620 [Vibrio ponticus]|uniref:Toxin VasX N-terminal region domain-containing protein n=1 Tax=Vibrio ponticus TaxID=265668 RepID=A0ABX3FG10_9VIBR|nr:toxin VasX [Vibrio ponticus]OLQ89766.1 hypothetical protein BIY21_14620 [Vibrio ponticus]
MSANFSSAPACKPIIPIYPVRYGYINIFDDLVPAANPPELSVMMNNRDVKQTKGYAIRLLREGWVYIREEDSNELLHIFKYTQKQNGDAVTECFEKYLYKNKKNAQGGLVLDTSVRKDLPFAFVSADTSQISIVYTEHELSPNLIDRMHQKKDVREQSMQLIDLSAEQTSHSVKATEENLKGLVEDYRDFKERMLTRISGDGDELEEFSLDVLTTQPSYQQDSELLAEHLKQEYCNQDRARLVALFDPVGRQMELSQVHAKLTIWENDHAAMNIYPYTIGEMVNGFLIHKDPEIKKIATDNIDTVSHDKYWSAMRDERALFFSRRVQILELYSYFSQSDRTVNEVGTLTAFIHNFIDLDPSDNPLCEREIQKLALLSCLIFDGLMSSSEGSILLTDLINKAHSEELVSKNVVNTYELVVNGLFTLVTIPQSEFNWDKATKVALDAMYNWVGSKWGEMRAIHLYGQQNAWKAVNQIKASAAQYTVDKLIPSMLSVFGLEIDGEKVKLSADELTRTFAQALDKQIAWGKGLGTIASDHILENAESKMKVGQDIFDWGEQHRQGRLNIQWELAKVKVTRLSGEHFSFVTNEAVTGNIGILFDSGFAGLSAFFNISSITAIALQTDYDQRDPLKHAGRRYDALAMTSAISALTVDTLSVARGAMVAGQGVVKVLPARVAVRLLPGLKSGAEHTARLLAGRAVGSLIAIANFATAATSFYNAWHSFNDGQTELGIGHAAIGMGSSLLFVGAVKALVVSGGGAVATGVGLPVGVACFALALIVGGVSLVYAFEKNPLENLLFYCFWGKSKRYPFWNAVGLDNLAIKDRLYTASNEPQTVSRAYQVELQEFMNLLAMPQLTLDLDYKESSTRFWFGNMGGKERTCRFQFKLPQFRPGVSEMHAGLYTRSGLDEMGRFYSSYNDELTKKFKESIKQALLEPSNYDFNESTLSLDIKMEFNEDIKLIWVYKPTPDIVVPLRWLNRSGELKDPVIGMLNDQFMEIY